MNKEEIFEELLEYFKRSNKNQFGYEQDKLISYEEAQIILNKFNKQKEVIDKIKEYIKSLGTQDGMIKDYMIDKNIKETILELLEEIE